MANLIDELSESVIGAKTLVREFMISDAKQVRIYDMKMLINKINQETVEASKKGFYEITIGSDKNSDIHYNLLHKNQVYFCDYLRKILVKSGFVVKYNETQMVVSWA